MRNDSTTGSTTGSTIGDSSSNRPRSCFQRSSNRLRSCSTSATTPFVGRPTAAPAAPRAAPSATAVVIGFDLAFNAAVIGFDLAQHRRPPRLWAGRQQHQQRWCTGTIYSCGGRGTRKQRWCTGTIYSCVGRGARKRQQTMVRDGHHLLRRFTVYSETSPEQKREKYHNVTAVLDSSPICLGRTFRQHNQVEKVIRERECKPQL